MDYWVWFDSAAGSFAARAPTVVDVIPGLTRNLWKVGGGLIQTLNQVQGDGLRFGGSFFLCDLRRRGTPLVAAQRQ